MNLEIAFIGAGKMVSAIVKSLLRGETYKSEQIACCSANDGTSEKLSTDTGIARLESIDQMLEKIKNYDEDSITEVHIVGGVHPKMGLNYFVDLIKKIKLIRPKLHIKAFTAVELDYMCKKAKVSYKKGLKMLKAAGQNSLPGGGAEIFAEDIRNKICKEKCTGQQWLEIHETDHEIGMPSNATML